MGLQDISLTDYDMVVAVTEAAINNALDGWLRAQPEQVALYYTIDESGNYIPATAETATISFTGTLAPEKDPTTHKYINFVNLYTPEYPQTVQYNLTFTNAEFKASMVGIDLQQGSTPWGFQFYVQLALQPTTIDQLPANVQSQIQSQVENLGLNMFSIQQLWVDLNTAALASFQGIDGLSELGASMLTPILKDYLKQQQAQAAMIFGYSAQYTGSDAAQPTLMPTALDFCVTPYTPIGANTNVLDTLNYLVMVQNNPLPAYAPTSFPFNWVDQQATTGAVAIRHDFILNAIIPQLSGILQTISPVLNADAHANGDDGAIYVQAGSPASFTINSPPLSGNVIASYSYAPTPAYDHVAFFGGSTDATGQYASTCQVQIGVDNTGAADPTKILVSGTATFSGSIFSSNVGGGSIQTTIPETTYSWYIVLEVQADLANTGQLDLVITSSDFSSDPVVTGKAPGFWATLFDELAHSVQDYASGVTGLRTEVQNQVINNILGAMQSTLASANHFIFPGAQTFLFANPQFAPTNDLVANINYQD